ncbi:BC1872 family protein [Paenibacillus sp. FSL R7-0128]|uniref:BC1872 family protein n=1 Tax=Paenibacillus sp. FSL R7-0128 TaxID=2954529 RepID=UPI00404079CE
MTRDEITAKWAGLSARERDAWIAEVVFDWFWDARIDGARWFNPPIGDPLRGCAAIWGPDGIPSFLPRYSTDITAAWTVYERYPYIETARIPGDPTVYGVRINGLDGSVRVITQESTFPDALCLAALIVELTEVSADVAV